MVATTKVDHLVEEVAEPRKNAGAGIWIDETKRVAEDHTVRVVGRDFLRLLVVIDVIVAVVSPQLKAAIP